MSMFDTGGGLSAVFPSRGVWVYSSVEGKKVTMSPF